MMPPHQRQLRLAASSVLLMLLVQPWTAMAFLRPPAAPLPLRPSIATKKPVLPVLPLRPPPPPSLLVQPCRSQRRDEGEAERGQGQQPLSVSSSPLDELERQLKGEEPPTVYVQQTPEGKMRIPLPPGPNRVLILFSVVTALFLGLLGVGVGHFVGVPPLETLSLQPGGVATGVILALPLFAVDFILQGFQEDTASEVYSLSIFGTKTPLPLVLALAAAVTLATGIGEEVLFRGLIQEGLSSVFGGVGGLVFASVAFGLSHKMGPADISFITAAGAYMGGTYLVLHDLTVPIVLHATYDFLILTSAYFRAKIRIGPSSSQR